MKRQLISPTTVLLKYYGLANQVFYEVYVSSETKFNHFEYAHVIYKYVASRMSEGVFEAKNTTRVRITDMERTVVDSIRDFNKIGGFEELLNCLEGIHYLDEKKLKRYLDIYNIQGLYQRVGYLFDHYPKELKVSEEFIENGKGKIGKMLFYTTVENKCLNAERSLMKLLISIWYPKAIQKTLKMDTTKNRHLKYREKS